MNENGKSKGSIGRCCTSSYPEAVELESIESDHEFETMENIQQAHDRIQINTGDSHRADKKKKEKREKKRPT